VAIPEPDLSRHEETARRQVATAREELAAVLNMPGVADEARADAYGRVGMAYHAYGLLDAAEAAYRNATALAPAEARWWYYLGHAQKERGDLDAAAASFGRATEVAPESIPSAVALGRIELDRGNTDQAVRHFERAAEVDPGSAAALVGLGQAALASGDHAAAAERFERALAIDPAAGQVRYSLGLAYRGLGREDEAAELLAAGGGDPVRMDDPWMAALDGMRGGFRVHLDRGTRHFEEGRLEEALAEFRAAADEAPDDPTVLVNLGSTLTKLERYGEAVEAYRAALAAAPDTVMAHFNLGTLAARFGHDDRAIEHYEAALAIDPSHASSHFNMANALRRLARHDDALPHYRAVLAADPGNRAARHGEVFALLRLERYAEAKQRIEEGVAALPDDPVLEIALVRVLAAAPVEGVRDGERALGLARSLAEERGQGMGNMLAYAQAAAEAGQFDEAVRIQEAVIEQARRANVGPVLRDLEADYRSYQARKPSRVPWPKADPLLTPRPVPKPAEADPWAG
jgi:tetratricopeptide (TPR) repeat protein